MSLSPELNHSSYLEQLLAQVQGIEVFEQATLVETGETLAEYYSVIRENIANNINPEYIMIKGLNGVGKGALAMGLYLLLTQDRELHTQIKRMGKRLSIVTNPFAMAVEGAKRQGDVPADIPHGGFLPEHYRAISRRMLRNTDKYVATHPDEKPVVITETSGLYGYPIPPHPFVKWERHRHGLLPIRGGNDLGNRGKDRGLSVGYTLSVDLTTRNQVQILALRGDNDVQEKAAETRQVDPSLYIPTLRDNGTEVIFVPNFRGKKDQDRTINTRDLLPSDQEELSRFLAKMCATPAIAKASRAEFRQLSDELFPYSGVAHEGPFYDSLQEDLRLPKGKLVQVSNKHISSATIDLGYLAYCLEAQIDRTILPKWMRKQVTPSRSSQIL